MFVIVFILSLFVPLESHCADFEILKVCGGDTTAITISTDANGDIVWIMDSQNSCTYINDGVITCNNFYFGTMYEWTLGCSFVNKGTINASGDVYIGGFTAKIVVSQWYSYYAEVKVGGTPTPAFAFDCGGTINASNIYINYKYRTPDIKGVMVSSGDIYISETGQGQNLTFDECSMTKAKDLYAYTSGGTMYIDVYGHIIADEFHSNHSVHVNGGSIVTVGGTDLGGNKIITYKGSSINMCMNPSTGISDDLFYCLGDVLYVGSMWGSDPEEEGDINVAKNESQYNSLHHMYGDVKANSLIGAYSSYDNCMEEMPDVSVLAIRDTVYNTYGQHKRHIGIERGGKKVYEIGCYMIFFDKFGLYSKTK